MSTLRIDIRVARGDFNLDTRFELPASGVIGVLGPSGSGKTTLMSAIAGIVKPREGVIAIGDEVFFDSARNVDLPIEARGCGVVFQDARLFPHMSVEQNLRFGLTRRRGRAITHVTAHVIEMLGIGHLAKRRPATLSGGERQRVAIGRALLSQPRLLLLDEPISAVDQSRKDEILPYLERLRDEAALPILYVSHALDEMLRLADQVVLIAGGRCEGAGSAALVLSEHPATGERRITVFDGTVIEHDRAIGLTLVATSVGNFRIPMTDTAAGKRLRLVIEARDVALATAELTGLSIRNRFRATITRVERLDQSQALVALAASGGSVTALLTHDAVADLHLAPGAEVWCLVKSVAVDRVPV
ncbi:MAG: molybdenum ABC transporter ATP-binding protein [Hyphomicrobiales bacterium]|nr:molybdenum ABC transporter ATP-binding protein [Hyphomicrobiales bacterium]MBV9136313.1 molybdenum ABC transporter ATP-binding protein [Hyphomicrobiales bacterium]MBV9588980.1 molybdenum ABC transporter ATP-binding protein [Hyphomicrobiales bacterium]